MDAPDLFAHLVVAPSRSRSLAGIGKTGTSLMLDQSKWRSISLANGANHGARAGDALSAA
jgi:hypothetical protein